MKNIQKLIESLSDPSYSDKYTIAKNSQTCVLCGKQANEFSSLLVRFEYNISAICEMCQKKFIYKALH